MNAMGAPRNALNGPMNDASVHGATLPEMNRITTSNLYVRHRADGGGNNGHISNLNANAISQPPTPQNVVFDCSPSTSLGARESSYDST